jgi:hypothetical protein
MGPFTWLMECPVENVFNVALKMSLESLGWPTFRQPLRRGNGFDEEQCVLWHDSASDALNFYTGAGRRPQSKFLRQ